ncbi:MAG: ATP-binding protein [Clostridiales bacterium]|nr:ATP-binding protein [Clostridiales bacterium]
MPDTVWFNVICCGVAVLISAAVSLFVREKFYRQDMAAVSSVMFIGGGYLAAIVIVLLLHSLTAESLPVLDFSNAVSVLTVMAIALTAVCIQLSVVFMQSRRKRKKVIADGGMFLMTFEFSGLVILLTGMVSARVSQGMENGRKYLLFFGIVFLVANLAVLLLVRQSEQESAERTLEEVRHRAGLERIHYERVEARRQELAQIQCNYNEVLARAYTLLGDNQTEQAKKLLENLSVRVDSTRENQFCRIPVINAVLAEKEAECERTGIILAADLILPDEPGIKDLDLCMALGNLLDNAIRECRKLPEKATIRLGGRVVQNYLVLRCVNPIFAKKSEDPEGTGYGLKILKEIAKRYGGDFFAERSDGMFTAQLSLPVSAEGAELL